MPLTTFISSNIAPQGSADESVHIMVNSKHPLPSHDALQGSVLAIGHDSMSRKRPTLRLPNLFARPPGHTSPDSSTPSVTFSNSRSPSPTSSFLIDDDPFAKIDSPIIASLNFAGLDSPPSTSSTTEFIQIDPSARSPLAPCQPILQRRSHEHNRPPVSWRAKPHKLIRNTPSLPSLSDLARDSGMSYASAIGRSSVSKRFPLEPWDLPEILKVSSVEPDENYDSSSQSKFANLTGTRPHRGPVVSTSIKKSLEPAESRKSQSRTVPKCSTLSPDAHEASFCWTYLSEDNCTSHQVPKAVSHHAAELHCGVQDGPSWWDVVHDSKDAMESEEDEDELEDTLQPPMYEATRQQGQGYRADMLNTGGREGEEDTSSDDTSDGYGSDSAKSGGYGGGGGSGQGRDDDDGDDDDLGRSAFSDDQSTDEDESEDSEDSEDNVPLAQRIPGALQAQKSIRIKAKAERERRRRERLEQKHASSAAARAPKPHTAPIPEDLTKRLLQVQATESASLQHASAAQGRVAASSQPPQAQVRAARSLHRPAVNPAQVPQPRHVSLEESRMRHNVQESSKQYVRETNSAPLSRHPTTAPRSRKTSLSQPMQAHLQSQSREGVSAGHRRPSNAQAQITSQQRFQLQHDAGQHHSQDLQHNLDAGHRKSHDVAEEREGAVVRARTLSSAAAPTHRVLQRTRTSASAASAPPPMPPMPVEVKRHGRDPTATQHRVFVGDMQRFNTVEINAQTRAKDVLDLCEAQGELRGEAAAYPGGWMLWELAQDFGMERPLREYELPAEVYASWNSDTRLNAFMIKKTPLAAVLARKAMPSSSPRCSGYVQWESKRGKWNKRWMELREHSIWLSKRDTGKDETFLCSLSNFDCYYVSRLHKAPKSFVFAVKSTDNLTLFENPADYLHVFSCDLRDGQHWVERILLARSYVLHKERTVLFSTPASTSSSAVPPPSSSSSHKSPPPPRPAAPLVNVSVLQASAAQSTTAAKGLFQSGSLLSKTSA